MMTQEELTQHIRKKLAEGYEENELRDQLLVQGYGETEIANGLLLAAQRERPTGSPLMILVSLLFIGLGIWKIKQGVTAWGFILLGWGIGSLVIRIWPLLRR